VAATVESRTYDVETTLVAEDLVHDDFSSEDFTDLYGPEDMWDEYDLEPPTLRMTRANLPLR
jgi:hypothetical protein